MAEPKEGPLSTPMYDIKTPTLEGVNPMGFTSDPEIVDRIQRYKEAQEGFLRGLEQRYTQPNFFNIASELAKPQLGGFGASMGSAFGALSNWQEQQRAMMPTLARQRAEIARADIMLEQAKKSAKPIEKAITEGRIPSAAETLESEAWAGGPKGATRSGQEIATAQQNQLVQLLQEGRSYADLVSKLPKDFVDRNLPYVITTFGLKPPVGMPMPAAPQAPAAAPEAKPATSGHIPGVPSNVSSTLPVGPQVTASARNVESMIESRDKINTTLTQQATTAVPIFEVATNLYKAASNPALAPAFGVFEKGDALSILGKAVESGSFPNVIANMRQYITQARLGKDEKKQALSDLQALEGTLADLQTKMQNGVINPTDVRTMFESESIPGTRNTQDAFLRGVARIGSDALSRYETKAAFDQALQDPDFNVMTWASSPYYSSVQDYAKKRTQALITNPASVEMPKFMKQGLAGSYQYKKSSGEGSKERPKERVFNNKTYVLQADGSYKEKGE